ncbi:MAG: hypothetical protein QF609_02725, partial [Gammaproteobacteria bacterium]|nr:hypothetical protein [Gammaproteobacteria bacterium]
NEDGLSAALRQLLHASGMTSVGISGSQVLMMSYLQIIDYLPGALAVYSLILMCTDGRDG